MRILSLLNRASPHDPAHAAVLGVVALMAAGVLVLTASGQLYDTNFQTLWESTALLAGDHPYRDFFEWGLPLQAYVSAAAQVVTGHRLIGEFLVHWVFIVAGTIISCHLALRLSQSLIASLVTMGLALVLLAATPTYHYPKLFFYPLGLWLSWRYLERPDPARAAALGLTTAVAFLFRHDHGMYIGVLAVVVFALARAAVPASRNGRRVRAELASFTVAAAILLVPWLVIVQRSEGLFEYVQARAYLYEEWGARGSPFSSLLRVNPVRTLIGERSLPPTPAVVGLTWSPGVDAAARVQLERRYGLRPLDDGPDERGLWRYEVANVYDADLWGLRSEIDNADSAEGLDWDRLERLQRAYFVPTREAAEVWLHQVVVLTPILLLIAAGLAVLQSRREGTPLPPDVFRLAAAAIFLVVIERSLREESYAMAVAPLTAAFGARLLAGAGRSAGTAARSTVARLRSAARMTLACGMLLVTALATFAYTRGTGIYDPIEAARAVGPVFAGLTTSPPIDAYQPPVPARLYDWQMWDSGAVNRERLLLRYLHDCTRDDDRILVTGSTPYHINYYTGRSVAGGHLFWHIGWRSDPVRETELLELLERQSVPFAFSTHDPVLTDLKRYPSIHEYFATHYETLRGTQGLVLVDTRRPATREFGRLGFPCFR